MSKTSPFIPAENVVESLSYVSSVVYEDLMNMIRTASFDLLRVRDHMHTLCFDLSHEATREDDARFEQIGARVDSDLLYLDKVINTLVWSADALRPEYRRAG